MCGITGIWRSKEKIEFQEIKKFTDSLAHRGPDGFGYEIFETDNLALGHRRLSILDLTKAGKQPMYSNDNRYVITYNGEVYNFIEIKNELENQGIIFNTKTDTEVILQAYINWGTKAFDKFNGMWAFAIWDNLKRELLLCRDRFGVKPLYYLNIKNSVFAFCSETIGFKYLKDFDRKFEEEFLIRQICNHNILEATPYTIYNSINQLQPGHLMRINSKREIIHEKWWSGFKKLSIPTSFEEQCEGFKNIFTDACKIRLRSDVPIGTALSGGLDSTAVFCMLNRIMDSDKKIERVATNWQKSFSMTFPGSKNDEYEYIKEVYKFIGREGLIIVPDNLKLEQDLVKSTQLSDFISGTPLNCVTGVYESMNKNGIVVSMDGHGVDEYLYGYTDSVEEALLQAYINKDDKYAYEIENILLNMNPEINNAYIEKIKTRLSHINNSITGRIMHRINSFIKPSFQYDFPKPESKYIKHSIAQRKINLNTITNKADRGEAKLLEQFNFTDIPYNLRDFDRGSMQHHVEIRMPFMDYRLVNYCFNLPPKSKLNNSYTKYILRKSLSDIMPQKIMDRKNKIGLSSPIADWFNGSLSGLIQQIINEKKLQQYSWINLEALKKTVNQKCINNSWDMATAKEIWPFINLALISK